MSHAAETLDRGMIAMPHEDGSVYLGWRLLASDPTGRVFNIYRATGGTDLGASLKNYAHP